MRSLNTKYTESLFLGSVSINRCFNSTSLNTTKNFKLGYFQYHLEKSKVGWRSNPDTNDFRDWYEQNKDEQHERTNKFIRRAFCVSGGLIGVYLSWEHSGHMDRHIADDVANGMFSGLSGLSIGWILGYKNHYTLPIVASATAFITLYSYALKQRKIMKELHIKEWQHQKKDAWIKEYKDLNCKEQKKWNNIEEYLDYKKGCERYWNNGGVYVYDPYDYDDRY